MIVGTLVAPHHSLPNGSWEHGLRQGFCHAETSSSYFTFTSSSLVTTLFLEHFPSTPWVLVNTVDTVPGTDDPSHLMADLDE